MGIEKIRAGRRPILYRGKTLDLSDNVKDEGAISEAAFDTACAAVSSGVSDIADALAAADLLKG